MTPRPSDAELIELAERTRYSWMNGQEPHNLEEAILAALKIVRSATVASLRAGPDRASGPMACGCIPCVCPDEYERCGGCGGRGCRGASSVGTEEEKAAHRQAVYELRRSAPSVADKGPSRQVITDALSDLAAALWGHDMKPTPEAGGNDWPLVGRAYNALCKELDVPLTCMTAEEANEIKDAREAGEKRDGE